MSSKEVVKKEKAGKLQWFLFVVVIPLLFTITLLLVILTIAGINVFDLAEKYGSKIPVVSSFIEDDEKKLEEDPTQMIVELEATIKDNEAKIESLNYDLQTKNEQLAEKQTIIDELTIQLEEMQKDQQSQDEKLIQLSEPFLTMDPKAAALIIAEMDQALAIQILTQLDAEQRGEIFTAMDPKKVAELSAVLMENPSSID